MWTYNLHCNKANPYEHVMDLGIISQQSFVQNYSGSNEVSIARCH